MAASGVLVGRGYVSIRPEFEGDWSRSVNARASDAGKSGSAAFGRAFGAGLKGIGALAGVAVAANLKAATASAALLAPALTTAGAAAGALKLGMSGVGDAFKAAFADTSKDASAAASSTRAVEAAQRGLANAQRALADAREQAAERMQDALQAVEDAERKLTRTVADAAQKQADAKRKVQDAVRELAESQADARKVQASLTEARKDAAREIEDLNTKLANSRLEEREATIAMADAEKALRAAQAKPGNRPEDIAKLQLAYDQAAQAVADQRQETERLTVDAAKANKAGVDGSDRVLKVQEQIADSQREVADRTRALSRAREEQRRTEVDSAQDIADAQRAVADAHKSVADARSDGARQIADAQRAVADAVSAVADAQASAAGQASEFDKAMAKLSPNARSFVTAVQGLKPAWDDMKLSVQNALFQDLDDVVTTLGNGTIPILKSRLTETAGVWNQLAKSAASGVAEMASTGMLDKILRGATANLAAFKDAPKQLITAFGQLSVAAQPAFNALSHQMAGALKSFTDGIAKSFASGGLEQAITSAFGIISQFGTLLGNVLGTVGQIFKAASDAGAEIVGSLGAVFGELRKVLATDEMQASMRSLFGSIAQIVSAIVPVIGTVVQAVVPLLTAIAQPIAQIATVLGPVLQQLASALGAALLPIVQALGPVLVTIGTAIVQLVQAVMPLLQPIADLITSVIAALAPALTPIVKVITDVVGVLVGPLTQIVQSLTPVLQQIGLVITQVFQALEPMLAPLVTLIGQVAELIAGMLAAAMAQLMPVLMPLIEVGMQLVKTVFAALEPLLPVISDALETIGGALLSVLPAFTSLTEVGASLIEGLAPLIPVGVQLITEVIDALIPVLPTVADAFMAIADALLGLAQPLAEVVTGLAKQLAPIIADLAPILGELLGMFAGLLADALPPLADALLILVDAFVPLLPLVGDLVGMLLKMAAGVLMDLLPSIVQLVQASIDLIVALLPLVPPLAQLIGLVVTLAVKVVAGLLPPLLALAGFLIGGLSSALNTVIGWITGTVSTVAKLVSWVTTRLGPAFVWLRDKVVLPVWGAIRKGIAIAWDWIKKNILSPIRTFFTSTVPGWGTTLKNKTVGAWNGMRDGFGSAWSWIKKHVLSPIRTFFTSTVPGWGTTLKNKMVGAFDDARAGIKRAWDKVQGITKKPISFVIKTVFNKGIVGVWNRIATAFGAPELKEFHPKGFARGGVYDVLPGYTPGRDPHKFYSPSGMALEMSGGESIFRPEFTRAVGARFVSTMNHLARSGGAARVREALAPVLGRTPAERPLHYADGGTVQRFAGGGVFGWIKDTAAGVGSAAWDGIKKTTSWLGDGLEASARAGIKHVVDPLLAQFPGADTGFGKMIRRLPTKIIDALFGYSKDADDKGGGGTGKSGKPVNAAIGTRFGVPGSMWSSGYHTGTDFPAPTGTPVRAVLGGSITSATSGGPYGNHIRMAHAGGLSTLYAHLSSMAVKTGQRVAGGARIGAVGSTGNSTGPHLHLEARRNGKLFDPATLFDNGGWLPPGGLGYNGLTTPEAVFTPHQLRALEGAAAVGVASTQGASTQYVINARTADFTVRDLERVQRVQEARARVGRPR
ncbi:peptidoglycan DD-metalloendopeptidase family protein [Streptomyces hirsutus]|uniref:peptidoglycan DD-metalloendopeptidase family protein n=1 Tax=Streptomyces hirsutus TaxID=35620 RepID=UPI0036C47CB1